MCKNIFLILSTIVVLLTSCNNKATKPPYNLEQQSSAIISIPYEELGGVKTIPVKLNGITMTMIYDTGCSGIHLSLNEVQTLVKNGKLDIDDILDASYTTIADGSIVENGTINIKRIEIGGEDGIVLENKKASVALNQDAPIRSSTVNCSTYIFGELSSGYSQYPEDSSSNLFKSIYSMCNAPSQLIIHRDESIMYYIYIRKINAKRYIGLAVAINGYYFSQINSLFSLFEKQIELLAERGIIINYSKSGELTTSLSSLIKEETEILNFANNLQDKISSISSVKKLPQVDYSVSIKSQIIFNEFDNNDDIVKASYTYGFTIILKQHNYDTLRATSYKNTLKQLNTQNENLTKEIDKLRESNKQILRQKKQFKKVVFLFIAVIESIVGIFFLYENLNNTQYRLDKANTTIKEKDNVITVRNERISNLKDSVINLETSLQQVNREKSELSNNLHEICNHYPFIVTSCDVNSERFNFDYYCIEEKEITVTLKAINDSNSEIVTSNHTLTFYKGGGTKSLYFSKKLNNQSYHKGTQYYYIVLIYNGQIIAGKYW